MNGKRRATPIDLDDRERDLHLMDRHAGGEGVPTEGAGQEEAVAADTLEALHARIERARRLEPTPRERHCADCWHKGRDAVIRVLLEEDSP